MCNPGNSLICFEKPFIGCSCTGTEERIEDCASTTGTQAEECGHERDVGIECNIPDTSQCSQDVLHNVRDASIYMLYVCNILLTIS